MKAIYQRELRSYFITMLGWVFIGMFLILTGILFYINTILQGAANVKTLFGLLTTWAVFILPMLTMRLFAEDKKLKTDQLLLTAPISTWDMVLGKYFAALTVVTGTLALFLLYIAAEAFFGYISPAETLNCFFGFWLLCAFILALGGFISAVSESQVVAIILTYAVLITTVFMDDLAYFAKPSLRSVLLWLSPTARFNAFTMGILDFSAVVYYASLAVLFICLTVNAVERHKNA